MPEPDAPPVIPRGLPLPDPPSPVVLPVDKPQGMTSFGVVRRIRKLLGVKKVGHAGTLDPMATGLLLVLVGREATRLQDQFMGLRKSYTGTIRLGETTSSYDAETEVLKRSDASTITDGQLESVREEFIGEITQLPPMHSAVKVGGERLYKKARRGESIERQPRPVTVYRFDWVARHGPDVDFIVECSKGTYIRTLAHDVGEALGVGAHLVALRREGIGPYGVDEAWSLEGLALSRGIE